MQFCLGFQYGIENLFICLSSDRLFSLVFIFDNTMAGWCDFDWYYILWYALSMRWGGYFWRKSLCVSICVGKIVTCAGWISNCLAGILILGA
ncbi:hypothetical protein KFK09_017806 [Dendrobium nobile]|uniref:Uncharacterized protein n=1 Tax=Dendrobium nobile TaxID=94219 RepID=A0A8T3ATZ2_DENNO|nr:hypothetical protein KFK09_017806 [Dendrobium nobile]